MTPLSRLMFSEKSQQLDSLKKWKRRRRVICVLVICFSAQCFKTLSQVSRLSNNSREVTPTQWHKLRKHSLVCHRHTPWIPNLDNRRFLQCINYTEDKTKQTLFVQTYRHHCLQVHIWKSKRINEHTALTKINNSFYQVHRSPDQPAPPRSLSRCRSCQSQLQWSWSPL